MIIIIDSMKCFFSHGFFKRFIVVLVVELDLCLLYFVIFIKNDGCGALICFFNVDCSVLF